MQKASERYPSLRVMMKISWLVVTNLWVCEFLRHQSFPSRWQDWALALDQDTSCYN